MSKKIKLRNLLNLTEQAPQPPMASPATPVPAPVLPAGMSAGGAAAEEVPPTPPPAETSPEPEDPSEYDFTRDFRAFEDKKNKAESDAKKVLLDKMNKRLLNKTVVANASRGYGQPKTDYTIENIKKISVEFWYKDYVVIATDQNDKKYFLTPGINIKIESEGSQPAPGAEEKPIAGPEVPPQEQPAEQPPKAGDEEEPNVASPSAPSPEEQPPQAVPMVPTQEPAPMAPQQTVPKQAPAPAEPSLAEPEPEIPHRKKKKKLPPVAEWIQKDLNIFLVEFMSDSIKDENGKVNFLPYIKKTSKILAENVNTTKIKYQLLIPENHMINNIDNRDIKLAAIDAMRRQTYYGQYSKGLVDIVKNGRYYLLEYVKEIGWNV